MVDIITRIGMLFPRETVKSADELMSSAGSKRSGAKFIGIMFIYTLAFMIILIAASFYFKPLAAAIKEVAISIHPYYVKPLTAILSVAFSIIGAITLLIVVISYYSMKAEARKNALESVLPDFLVLVSSNMRGGMTLDQAMWQSAKPEFGVLSVEVRQAIKESFTGKSLEKALDDLAKKFNSKMMKRVIEILKQSIKSGGEIASVLEKTADEAREIYLTKKEIKSTLIVYVIFLLFAGAFGVPFLFSVSQKLIEVLYKAFSLSASVGGTASVGNFGGGMANTITLSAPPITPKDFYYFSLVTIFVSNFITSFIIGAAYTGNKNNGIRYLPFMLFTAYVVYFLTSSIIGIFFQGMM